MKMTREYYIPANSTEVTDPNGLSVAYTYGKLCACGFGGKRSKPDWNYSFRTEKQRTDYIQRYFRIQRQRVEEMAERKAERKAAVTTLQVGDILSYTWGYEQTNVQFYQVVEVKPSCKMVVIREIGKDIQEAPGCSSMSGQATPCYNSFKSEEILKRSFGDYVSMDFSSARKWDGRPEYISWYA